MKTRVVSAVLWLVLLATSALGAVLGIDYGQENTKGAIVAPGLPFEIVLSADSKRKDLSGINFKKVGGEVQRVFGNGAASGMVSRYPEGSAVYLKQLLGVTKDNGSVSTYQERFPAAIVKETSGDRKGVALDIHNEVYPVEEVVAMQFGRFRDRASDMLKAALGSGYVKDTAVTVPVHFNTEQRRALMDAVEISGLKLISLVNDGVAVAINFASTRQFDSEKQYHIIYDVGAGSTTATLVSMRKGEKDNTVIEVEGVGYNDDVGGHALTERLRGLLVEKFLEQHPKVSKKDLFADARALNKLWNAADRAKTVLSANSETSASVESLYKDIDFKARVSRDEFESACADLRSQVTDPIQFALQNPLNATSQAIPASQINSIILTGGSVRVPFVQKELNDLDIALAKNVNADEAAVLGATLRGVGISKIFKSKDIDVVDRSIWDYAIEGAGDNSVLFPRGTPLDTAVRVPLDTTQDKVDITVTEDGRPIATYEISKIQSTLKGLEKSKCIDTPTVEAVFTLTNSRTVELNQVYASCLAEEKKTTKSTQSTQTTQSTQSTQSVQSTESDATVTGADTTSTGPEVESESAQPTEETSEEPVRAVPVVKTISFKTTYSGLRPMGTSSKSTSSSRLRSLDRADSDRHTKDEALNTLEGFIYRVKEFLTEQTGAKAEEGLEKLSEIVDWLDSEGYKAPLKTVQSKLEAVKQLRASFDLNDSESATTTKTTKPSDSPAPEVKPGQEDNIDPKEADANLREGLNTLNSLMDDVKEVYAAFNKAGIDPEDPNAELNLADLTKEAVKHLKDDEERTRGKVESLKAQIRELNTQGENVDELKKELAQARAEMSEVDAQRAQALKAMMTKAVQSANEIASAKATNPPVHDEL
uniref:ARAD1B15268p n=1 Tax=Blastobotrys adeninivorans TaxID=409370 RepID=A0A060T5Y2_BLAAD